MMLGRLLHQLQYKKEGKKKRIVNLFFLSSICVYVFFFPPSNLDDDACKT